MSFICTLFHIFIAFITLVSVVFSYIVFWFCLNRYFKPAPKWDATTGTLYMPKSCPIQSISEHGNAKFLKQIACLEACKQLHQIGALTDNLVPDMLMEEDNLKELGNLLILRQLLIHFVLPIL